MFDLASDTLPSFLLASEIRGWKNCRSVVVGASALALGDQLVMLTAAA